MVFFELDRNGLRDICLCLNAHKNRLYHLGIRQSVNQSTLSRANENRNWRIYADFGLYLIELVQPLYADNSYQDLEIDKNVFLLDSTTISVSIILMKWAQGKYSRGAVKMHTLLDLRGSIPVFIHVTDGKYHDVKTLDEIQVIQDAIYVMDKAYLDFKRLYDLNRSGAFFVIRAKDNLRFKAVKSRKVDKSTGLRCDQSIKLTGPKSKLLYPEKIRRTKNPRCTSGRQTATAARHRPARTSRQARFYPRRQTITVSVEPEVQSHGKTKGCPETVHR